MEGKACQAYVFQPESGAYWALVQNDEMPNSFEFEGLDDLKMVSARSFSGAKDTWSVIELTSGRAIVSGEKTRAKVEAESRKRLGSLSKDQLGNLIMKAKGGKSQETLATAWLEAAKETEAQAQEGAEIEHHKELRKHRGMLSDYTGKPVEEAGKPAPKKAAEQTKIKYGDGDLLGFDALLPFYLQEIKETEKGSTVPNPRFVIGEVSESTATEIARFITGYEGKQRRLRISGRSLKHIEESRPAIAEEVISNIREFFTNPDEVLPDHKAAGKRALLVHLGDDTAKLKHHVATVEVEIEIEIADGFIDIVSVMTSPGRSLKQARELKENWREGQQIPEQAGYSPHPIAAEATHAEADLPNVPPVDSSVANADDGIKAKTGDSANDSEQKISEALSAASLHDAIKLLGGNMYAVTDEFTTPRGIRFNFEKMKGKPLYRAKAMGVKAIIPPADVGTALGGMISSQEGWTPEEIAWVAGKVGEKTGWTFDEFRTQYVINPNRVQKSGKQQSEKATPAVANESPAAEPKAPAGLVDQHNTTIQKLYDGALTVDEFKVAFAQVRDNREAIEAELSKMTKAELLDGRPSLAYRYKNETKPKIIKSVYGAMLEDFILGNSISYPMGSGDWISSITKAIQTHCEPGYLI